MVSSQIKYYKGEIYHIEDLIIRLVLTVVKHFNLRPLCSLPDYLRFIILEILDGYMLKSNFHKVSLQPKCLVECKMFLKHLVEPALIVRINGLLEPVSTHLRTPVPFWSYAAYGVPIPITR